MTLDYRTGDFGRLFSEDRGGGARLSASERLARREQLFAESLPRRIRRVLGAIRADFGQFGFRGMLGVAGCVASRWSSAVKGLPDPKNAAAAPEGFCGLAEGLTPEFLLEGFAGGLVAGNIFGLSTWQAPRERMVLKPAEAGDLPAARDLLQRDHMQFSLDADFEQVVLACGRKVFMSPGQMRLYTALYDMGLAHSFEVRNRVGAPVAGGFGVAIGRVFITLGIFGESSATIALGMTLFNRHLAHFGVSLHDAIGEAAQTQLGFYPVSRADHFNMLVASYGGGRTGRWNAIASLCGPEAPAGDMRRLRKVA